MYILPFRMSEDVFPFTLCLQWVSVLNMFVRKWRYIFPIKRFEHVFQVLPSQSIQEYLKSCGLLASQILFVNSITLRQTQAKFLVAVFVIAMLDFIFASSDVQKLKVFFKKIFKLASGIGQCATSVSVIFQLNSYRHFLSK